MSHFATRITCPQLHYFHKTFAGDDSVSGSDPHKTVQIGDLRFLNDADLPEGQSSILGRGSFAVVRLARRAVHQKSGSVVSLLSMDSACSTETGRTSRFFRDERLVAVKILDKALLAKSKSMARDGDDQLCVTTALDNVQCEIDVMRRLSHPNIIGLDEVIDRGTGKLFVVLHYAALGEVMSPVPGGGGRYARRPAREGEPALAGVVDPGRHFDERTAALLFVDVLHGLAHLHARRVVHRDLKPEVRPRAADCGRGVRDGGGKAAARRWLSPRCAAFAIAGVACRLSGRTKAYSFSLHSLSMVAWPIALFSKRTYCWTPGELPK